VQDWRTHNPRYQPVAEITQSRGAFETDQPGGATLIGGGGASVQDALALGCRVGFVGGSDNLFGRPGTNYTPQGGADFHDHPTGGWTAVLAPELTRRAVHAALMERRCYATTGARIVVDFRVDGHMMGEEFETGAGEVRVTSRVTGTGRLVRLELLRNNAVIHAEPGGGRTAALDLTVALADAPTTWLYLRATQDDGQTAWASPVWISRRT
jgi:hypothetical protein